MSGSTSGTYTFNQNAYSLIAGALRLCGVIDEEETPSAAQSSNAMMSLNAMVKTWMISDIHVWTQITGTLFLQPGQSTYSIGSSSGDKCVQGSPPETTLTAAATLNATTISVAASLGLGAGDYVGILNAAGNLTWYLVETEASTVITIASPGITVAAAVGALVFGYVSALVRPLKVTAARRGSWATGNKVPLNLMSRVDFANIPNPNTTGTIEEFFYDPQLSLGQFSVSPAPVDSSTYIQFTAQRPIQDFDTLANIPDFPVEWLAALRWGLATEIAPEYDVPAERFQILQTMATAKLQIATRWDQEARGQNTYFYDQMLFKLIAGALRLCGAVGSQEIPTYGQVLNALDSLNAMIGAWQGSGIHVWTEEECILFLQPNQTQYSIGGSTPDYACLYNNFIETTLAVAAAQGATTILVASISGISLGDNICIQLENGLNQWTTVAATPTGSTVTLSAALTAPAILGAFVFDFTESLARPLRVPAGRRFQYSSKISTPLIMMARLDYDYLPNQYNTGVITQAFYDPQLNAGLMNVWPTPSDNVYAMRFVGQMPLNYSLTLASTPNFPEEWLSALRFNLAVEMIPEYPPDKEDQDIQNRRQLLIARAQEKLATAQAWDREPEPILFGMAMQPGYR